MDEIIQLQLKEDIKKNIYERSQIEFFHNYCNIHKNDIVTELREIKEIKGEIPDDIKEKLKKTYKNRFYKNRIKE
jgi:CHAD domain-containing protein